MIIDPKLTVILCTVVDLYFIKRNDYLFLHILVLFEYFDWIFYHFLINQNICIYTWSWPPFFGSECPTITFAFKITVCKNTNARIIVFSPHFLIWQHTVIMSNISRPTMNYYSFEFKFIKIFVFAMESQLLEFFHFFFIMGKIFHILQSKLLS